MADNFDTQRKTLDERESARNGGPRGTPMAAGETPIKQAVRWLDDQLRDHPDADRVTLIDQASRRFDLSPVDADFLVRHLAERGRTA